MKQKKYSESKINTAQNFLSKYDLDFNSLSLLQQKTIIKHTYTKKRLLFCIILLLLGVFVFSAVGFIAYESLNYFIGINSDLSAFNLESQGKACFALGFAACFHFSIAVLMTIIIILQPVISKGKLNILDVFLPSIKNLSDNDKTTSD